MTLLIPEIYLVDGENLVARYQAMKGGGRTPKSEVVHVPDVFVWTPLVLGGSIGDIRRVSYYTSVVGDEAYLRGIERQIRGCEYQARDKEIVRRQSLFPRVFKKASRSVKSRSVDINIVIDALRYAHGRSVGIVTIISGDGDFCALAQELIHAGVQVHILALSSGLSPLLEANADYFALLDDRFFEPAI